MLQGVQTQRGDGSGTRQVPDAEYPALLVQLVVILRRIVWRALE